MQQQQQPSLSLPDSSSNSSKMETPREDGSSSPLSLQDEKVSLSMELMMQALGASAVMVSAEGLGFRVLGLGFRVWALVFLS